MGRYIETKSILSLWVKEETLEELLWVISNAGPSTTDRCDSVKSILDEIAREAYELGVKDARPDTRSRDSA